MRNTPQGAAPAVAVAVLSLVLAGCGSSSGGAATPTNQRPSWLGTVTQTSYDGVSDDLLTAGLGRSGLQAAAPAVTDPTSAAQL
ncbi:MAG: 3-hydroxybutyrate oligomer hydrolase family protein, partial [Betaproteobacteria bacterium]